MSLELCSHQVCYLIFTPVLGIEPRAVVLSTSPALILYFETESHYVLPSCPGWAQVFDLSALVSQSAGVITMCRRTWLLILISLVNVYPHLSQTLLSFVQDLLLVSTNVVVYNLYSVCVQFPKLEEHEATSLLV